MPDSNRPSQHVDYDTFMSGDLDSRLTTFNAVSPEIRASLVSTHIRRWRDANRHRLSSDQLALTDEWLRFVTPDAYRSDRPEDVLVAAKQLEIRSAALFSREDMGQALTIHGAHIPPVDRQD